LPFTASLRHVHIFCVVFLAASCDLSPVIFFASAMQGGNEAIEGARGTGEVNMSAAVIWWSQSTVKPVSQIWVLQGL
jgi:hypothetical protein